MYEVSITQEYTRHKGTEHEYSASDTIKITVESADDIETIVGLFGKQCQITIDYIKEGEEDDKDA